MSAVPQQRAVQTALPRRVRECREERLEEGRALCQPEDVRRTAQAGRALRRAARARAARGWSGACARGNQARAA